MNSKVSKAFAQALTTLKESDDYWVEMQKRQEDLQQM